MAVMLPLSVEAWASPRKVVDSPGLPGSDESVRGIPLCALDMYSRAGRGALSAFCKSSSEVRRFRASCRTASDLQKAVAMAVFHLDSCHLTRHVVTATSDELRQRIEILELARFGISADERPHLYRAITADAGVLNRARDRVLRGLP